MTNIPEIRISQNGPMKLHKNLKPGKAAGPERLKPLLRRNHSDHQNHFDRSLQIGKLPADWIKANIMPIFNLWPQTTDLFPSFASFERHMNIF